MIAVEHDETQSTMTPPTKSYRQYAIWAILGLLVIASIFNGDTAWIPMLYKSLSIAGALVSYFIIKEQLGIEDTLTARVCGAISSSLKVVLRSLMPRKAKYSRM